MLVRAVEALSCAWLTVIALTALCTWPWRPAPRRPSVTLRDEPPAVVSLLAGRLERDGYPATLLDLAARGWIGLDEAEPDRVMCRPAAGRPDYPGRTAYERRALAHLEFRAAGMGVVPGTALGSGFEPGEEEFRKLFRDEVRADARGRGLLRSRIGRGTLALLEAAGAGCMVLADAAMAQRHAAAGIVMVTFAYLVVLQAPWALYRCTRLTRPGRAALAEWLGFRVALIGSRSGRTAGTAMLAVSGDRRIAYAAALGAAPDAVAAFSSSADRDHAWSSFGGSWHRVLLGSPRANYVPGPLALAGITAYGCMYGVIVLAAWKTSGPLWAAGLAVVPGSSWWLPALWVYPSAVRASRLPRFAEFDGQVLKRWTESDGDNGTDHCIAIDDGVSQRAWALVVGSGIYADAKAGTLVHVQVDPRRNVLIAMAPSEAPARW
jgi:Predicted membrane protein (DUF2207)